MTFVEYLKNDPYCSGCSIEVLNDPSDGKYPETIEIQKTNSDLSVMYFYLIRNIDSITFCIENCVYDYSIGTEVVSVMVTPNDDETGLIATKYFSLTEKISEESFFMKNLVDNYGPIQYTDLKFFWYCIEGMQYD